MAQGAAKTAAQLVAEAKGRVENLTPDAVAAELATGDATLIDIREPGERTETGTIPGAVHAPRGMLEFYADPTSPYHRAAFDPGRRTILHCASGGRSALAADTLRQLGYTNVAHLDGGLNAWKAAGQPVAEDEA
jgi:rhodanese-related sulfurtransferase